MSTKNKAFLFLNGDAPDKTILEDVAAAVRTGQFLCVCADGAYKYINNFFLPDVLIGDFDSVCRDDIAPSVAVVPFAVEKDYTDGHIAMEYILKRGIKDVCIYGALGGRADHMLSNFSLLALAAQYGAQAKMISNDFIVMLTESPCKIKTEIGKTVSLVPYSDSVHILYTKGLKYAICDRSLDKVHILGISNVAVASEIEYGITCGSALIFLQR